MILYLLWRLMRPACLYLPPRLTYAFGRWVGWVAFWTWPRLRHNARANAVFLLGFPEDPQRLDRLARRLVQSYAPYAVDFLRLPALHRNGWEKKLAFQGLSNLDVAMQEGKGVILVGLHLGSWDLGAAALAWHHYPVNVVVEDVPSPGVTRLVRAFREATGVEVISARDGRRMLAALRRGEILCLLIDRPCHNGGVEVSFLGEAARVPAGAATLALRTGARVLPGAVVHLPGERFLAYLGPSIPYQTNGHGPKEVQHLTQQIMTRLEGTVRQYPEQWCIYHPFWRGGNPGGGA